MVEEQGPEDLGDETEWALACQLADYHDRYAMSGEFVLQEFAPGSDSATRVGSELEMLELISSMVDPRPRLEHLGDFEILEEAGRGAMGVVYEARQLSLDRLVALKVLNMGTLDDSRAVTRFRREARIAARLQHPNIVSVYAMGIEAGTPYFAMEFADGITLRQVLERMNGGEESGSSWQTPRSVRELVPMGAEEVAPETDSSPGGAFRPYLPSTRQRTADDAVACRAYFREIADAFAGAAEGLQHAHSHGVVHRDLKPSNLILDSRLRLRILDFGLARAEGLPRLTLTIETPGTPLYMSPEQTRSPTSVVPATDIYSLGATLYEMLTGQPPFPGKDVDDVVARIRNHDPVPPHRLNREVPKELSTIALKCLRKSPSERYNTAEELAQDLRRFVLGDPIVARPQPLYERVARRAWRSRWTLLQVAGVAVILLTAGLLFSSSREQFLREKKADYDQRVNAAAIDILKRHLLSPTANLALVTEETILLGEDKKDAPIVTRATDGSSQLLKVGPSPFEAPSLIASSGQDPVSDAIESMRQAIDMFPEEPIAYYQLARGLFVQGRAQEALGFLDRALELRQDFLPALSLRVLVLERLDDPRAGEAHAGLSRIVSQTEESWVGAWLAAHQAVLRQEWKVAAQAFDVLDEAAVDDGSLYYHSSIKIETLLGRGVAHLRVGAYGQALSDFGGGVQLWRDWLDPTLFLGKTWFMSGDRQQAARILLQPFERATRRGDDSADDVAYAVAAAYRELGDLDEALKWSEKIRRGPARWLLQAELYWREGKLDLALDAVNALLRMRPDDPAARITLGNILMSRGDLDAALQTYREAALAARDEPGPLVAIGVALEARGDLADAKRRFEEAIHLDPASGPAHYNLARVLGKERAYEEAVRAYREAIRVDPGNAVACNNLAILYDQVGNQESARDFYERAIELAPSFALAHYNLGWLYDRESRFGAAAARYRSALDLGLDDSILHSNLAVCLQWLGKYSDSIEEYRSAIERNPDYSTPHHGLGTALIWKDYGQLSSVLPEVIETFEKAKDLEPQRADTRKDLGWALGKAGRLEEGITELRAAIELDPKYAEAYSFLAELLLKQRDASLDRQVLASEIPRLEDAALLVNVRPFVSQLLARYRDAFRPDLASYASIDWMLDSPETVVGDEAAWRFFRGKEAPPSDWNAPDFDDSAWDRGLAPFGYGGEEPLGTPLEDMKDFYTTLYIRTTFDVLDVAAFQELTLSVRADDGCVAYLNGDEVGRARAGAQGENMAFDGVATERGGEAVRVDFQLPAHLLNEGSNCLAFQGLNAARDSTDFELFPTLRGAVKVGVERDRARLSAFRQVAEETGAEARLAYLEGRVLQRADHHREAESWFRRVLGQDTSRPEPFLRIMECRLAQERPGEAARVLEESLRGGLAKYDRLWDRWIELRLGMHQPVATILDDLRAFTREIDVDLDGRPGDLLWLLERLAGHEAIRINCGGTEYTRHGVTWSQDRFFLGGWKRYLYHLDEQGLLLEDAAVHQNERYFDEQDELIPAYAIPLPQGVYRVTLHFTEGRQRVPGNKRFDVLLEQKAVLSEYDPFGDEFGVPRKHSFEVSVEDEALDVRFARELGNPVISGIEIDVLRGESSE